MTTPDTEALCTLVHLPCKWEGIPILHAPSTIDNEPNRRRMGAYCRKCTSWIKWVPFTEVWLDLWESQQNPAPVTIVPIQRDDFVTAIAEMGQFCYNQAEDSGFHQGRARQPLELCMLVVTELAELAEAFRNGKADAPSDHIPEFTFAEEEWADVLVRVFDHSHDHVDPTRLGMAFVAKLAFNRTRGHRHGGKTI